MTYTAGSPVFAGSRIGPLLFRAALVRHGSPAAAEAAGIYDALLGAGVDPAVFLGQFAAESSYGTAGYARTTRNPGNIVIGRPALPHWTRVFGGRPWLAPNGRTYAAFSSWRDGTRAYAALLRSYRLRGWATSIATMASHWLGLPDATYSGYVRNILAAANLMAAPPPTPPRPTPPPPPAAVRPALPPIPLAPTMVEALVSYTPPTTGEQIVLGMHPGLRFGIGGPIFVLVHGGPAEIGLEHVLSELGWRLAARGARTFAIDYRSDSWQVAVVDVEAAIADVRRLVGGPITLVAHSFGGLPASIAALRDGAVEAYVAVCAVSSAAGVGGIQAAGVPDPIVLATRRPWVPVTVVRGLGDVVDPSDDKEGFIAALHLAGHPGLNVMGPGDHTGTLYTDAALEAMFATSGLAAP